jgi:hypothetical protein
LAPASSILIGRKNRQSSLQFPDKTTTVLDILPAAFKPLPTPPDRAARKRRRE